jgi:hypothetical protein
MAIAVCATASLALAYCTRTPDEFGPAITLADQGGSRPTAAVDPRDGTVYVAWVGTHGGSANVYLARLEPGAERAAEIRRVNQIPGDAAPHDQAPARVTVGPTGEVYLAWQNNISIPGRRFPASNLRFARSTDRGTTFEPTIYINDDSDGPPASHTFHDMAIADDGTIMVTWIDSRGRAAEDPRQAANIALAAHGRPASGTTRDQAGAESDGHGPHSPAGPEIRLARSTDGGRTFLPSRIIDHEACPCCRTTLTLAVDGTAYIAWRKIFDGEVRDIVVARADAADTAISWDQQGAPMVAGHPGEAGPAAGRIHAPVRPHHDDWRLDACPHAGPALLADHDGNVHLAWYTGREGRAGLYYATSTDRGASFGSPVPILTSDALPPSQLALAADGRGGISIAWEDRRTAERTIRLARIERGSVTGATLALAGTTPALAAAAGTTALAWLDGEAVRVRITR